MTLRELINQVTDFDSESPVLDYELQFWIDGKAYTARRKLEEMLVDHTIKAIHFSVQELL